MVCVLFAKDLTEGSDRAVHSATERPPAAALRLVAREVGAPPPVSIPEEELIPVLGDWAVEAYTTCAMVDSSRARERLGWAPRYRTIEEGVPVVVRAWKRAQRVAA